MNNKLYSFINIIGLSIGLVCALIIFLYIEFELSFDTFYPERDQIYRVVSTRINANNTDTDGSTSYAMGYSIRNDFPDYKIASSFMMESHDILINGDIFKEDNVFFVDSLLCDIFTFEWLKGSPELINEHPKNIALSERIAEKYFGEQDPIGKTIIFAPNKSFQVVAIIKDLPLASSIHFSMMLSIKNLSRDDIGFDYDTWGSTISGFETYFKLPKTVDAKVVENQLNEIIIDRYANAENKADNKTHFIMQKLKDVHLQPDFLTKPNTSATSKSSLWVYAFIGLLIVSIAGINFINLTTAQGFKRAKEVGVRKVLGANKRQLSLNFIAEFAFTSFLAMVCAIIIIEVVLPYVNAFLGTQVEIGIYKSQLFFPFIVFLFIFINVITSLYPSLVMSRFVPVIALKGNLLNTKKTNFNLRNALLVFQFTISISLIIGTLVIKSQMSYVNNKDLGYELEDIMHFSLPDRSNDKLNSLRSFLSSEPGVKSYAFGLAPPSSTMNIRTSFKLDDERDQERRYMNVKPADSAYLNVFNLKLLAGQWLFETPKTDTVMRIVVNEILYKTFGFKDAFDAIGKKIPLFGNEASIIGVVKDFHSYSLRSKTESLAFINFSQYYYGMYLSVETSRKAAVIANVEQYMQSLFPTNFIESGSVIESINNMYEDENRTSTLISVLSVLAIFIAALGLFGIVSFMLVQRVKEIGIRKVLGASLQQLAYSLTRTYAIIILVSSFIAIPISWYFMSRWLNDFEYRIDIEIWIFLVATLFTLMISLITILFHVVKAGKMNPVESLKYE